MQPGACCRYRNVPVTIRHIHAATPADPVLQYHRDDPVRGRNSGPVERKRDDIIEALPSSGDQQQPVEPQSHTGTVRQP